MPTIMISSVSPVLLVELPAVELSDVELELPPQAARLMLGCLPEGGRKPMRDEWSSFADLLADLITKYAAEIDIDSLPDPDMSASPPQKETIMDLSANSAALEVENGLAE
ncbi:MAG: hypothetical protein LUD78_06065 [Clostridiales bacterium]|nr:hypothetical protein [Clostridiales bacterium]